MYMIHDYDTTMGEVFPKSFFINISLKEHTPSVNIFHKYLIGDDDSFNEPEDLWQRMLSCPVLEID